MVRGIFITREDAAALPHRITAEGYPESNTVHSSHHQRPPRSHAVAWGTPVAGAAPSVASSAHTNISAIPSNHEKWTDGEIELLINLRAEKVGFRYIAVSDPQPSVAMVWFPKANGQTSSGSVSGKEPKGCAGEVLQSHQRLQRTSLAAAVQ